MLKSKKTLQNRIAKSAPGTNALAAATSSALLGAAIIIIAVFISYIPALSGGFIWDDESLLTNNRLVKAPDGLYRIWFSTEAIDYWPATNTTFWLEWRLWGMNSTGYHAANIILHIAASLLIWNLLRKLSIPGAFLAALIFAVHPVNVESVAWIAQRKNTLSMFFFLLSVLWYLKTEVRMPPMQNRLYQVATPLAPRFSALFYWVSLAAFVLAMLSKGSVAVLPLLLLGIMWWLRKITWKDLARIAPFFVVSAVLAGINIWFQTHGKDVEIRSVGFVERLLGAGSVVWFYLYKALLPLNLAFVYPQWDIQADNLLWWLPLLSTLAITVLLWCYRKKWSRSLLFMWGFFFVALVPVLGLTDVYFMKYALVADHYQYIAIISVIALAAAGWSYWRRRAGNAANLTASGVAVMVTGLLMCLTWQQNKLYKNSITLYRASLDINPHCLLASYNLGNALVKSGLLTESIEHYQQAVHLDPDFAEAHNNFGYALFQTGRLNEAIEHYQQAVKLKPALAEAHDNLGYALFKADRLPESIDHLQQAVRLKPNFAGAHNNLGNALGKSGRPQEAIDHFQHALRINPEFAEAYQNLGLIYAQQDRFQEAIENFHLALQLKPDIAEIYASLALAYDKINRPAEAAVMARKALDIAISKGQTVLAKQIENWLNTQRAKDALRPSAPNLNRPVSPLPPGDG